MRLEDEQGRLLAFVESSRGIDLRERNGQIVRVCGHLRGQVISAEAPLLDVSDLVELAPVTMMRGGVLPFSPARLESGDVLVPLLGLQPSRERLRRLPGRTVNCRFD